MASEAKPGSNFKKKAIRVLQSSLRRADPGSLFKMHCPECGEGLLMCSRGYNYKLQRTDRCTFCGQAFFYLDKKIGEEELQDLLN